MFLSVVINRIKIRLDRMIELPLPFKETTPNFAFDTKLAIQRTTNTLEIMRKMQPDTAALQYIKTSHSVEGIAIMDDQATLFLYIQTLFKTLKSRNQTKFHTLSPQPTYKGQAQSNKAISLQTSSSDDHLVTIRSFWKTP